jgi:hypothetical protein
MNAHHPQLLFVHESIYDALDQEQPALDVRVDHNDALNPPATRDGKQPELPRTRGAAHGQHHANRIFAHQPVRLGHRSPLQRHFGRSYRCAARFARADQGKERGTLEE